ncbi:MAG: ABC transporter ATP-binding protein [Candidatus Aminicenantes bacterium]|nr:ABC transporter ATP-binding protein [Candidatus Aminicenantes bacterium]
MTKREFQVADEYRYRRKGPVRWILSHVMRYPLLPFLLLLSGVVNNVAYSNIQVFVGKAFDVVSKIGFQTSALLIPVVVILASALAEGLVGLLRNFSGEFLAQRIERDSREELYLSLLGKSQTFHGRQRIGDIMARATNDVRALNLMFSPGITLIVDSVLALVVPVIMIGFIDPRLLIVPLVFTGLLVITIMDYNRRLKPVSIAQREQFGILNAGLTEAVAGIEVVKANVRERYEWDKFTSNARAFRDYFIRQGYIQARYLPMLMFSLCWGAGFFHALFLWRQGAVTLGNVVAFMGLFGTLRFTTFISIFSFNLVQLGIASAERILNMIKTKTELDQNEEGVRIPIKGEVRFENVSFRYNGTPVLKEINFRALPGETVAIVGLTGSGKTSLTRLINRIFDVSSGRVLIDGIDVREMSLESLRSQISTIEQDVFLFSRTLKENIAFGLAEATSDAVEKAAREAQAHDFISAFPEAYDTMIGERGVTLSGGQKQRIAIARAFLTNPRILILDDSTSAIDSATEDQIQKAMWRISKDRTTFIITHRLSQIRWADRILVLRKGELVDQGNHEELMARSLEYRRIFARYD